MMILHRHDCIWLQRHYLSGYVAARGGYKIGESKQASPQSSSIEIKSGHRPRFKRKRKRMKASGEEKQTERERRGQLQLEEKVEKNRRQMGARFIKLSPSENTLPPLLLGTVSIMLLALVLTTYLLTSPAICDQVDDKVTLLSSSEKSPFRTSTRSTAGKQLRHHRRRPRHNSLQQQQQTDSAGAFKIAALSSKLEQWFACKRLQSEQLAIHQVATSAGGEVAAGRAASSEPTAQASCQAHYDKHLCWPQSPAGREVRLPCPHLNWLPSQQQQQQQQGQQLERPKSVINPIQLVASQVTNGSSALTAVESIKSEAQTPPTTFTATIAQREARFAYRKCEPHLTLNGNSHLQAAQWQTEANYSECLPMDDNNEDTFAFGGHFDPTDKWIKLDQEPDNRLFGSLIDELERIEGAIDPYSDPDLQEQWSLCIGEIMRHHHSSSNARRTGQGGDLWCPIIFDGWRCWPSTKAGETAYVGCPKNQPGFSAERKAHKICTPDGTWYRHPLTNRYWSNYTTCVDTVDLAFRTKILNLYVIGNLISLVALSASLIIFISFKSLNCTRVTIHKNLFLSFITNNLMWIIWYTYVVNDADLLQSNPIECQFWHILLHYFLVSNYFWMFCEGLYLHTLLVVAFVSEDKILKWFYLLGWLTPIPITVAYAYNRSYDDYFTNFCWMDESPYNLILMAPIGISLLLNLIFLINIVRVLVTKLRANNSPDTHQTRKAVRATLILIPLLGLHYILTPFRPEAKSEWEGIYECIAAVCTSFQGLCVAMLFCFCNGEVMAVIKKKLKDTFNLSQHHQPERMRSRCNTSASIIQHNFNLTNHSNNGSITIKSVLSSSTSINGEQTPIQARIVIAPNNANQQQIVSLASQPSDTNLDGHHHNHLHKRSNGTSNSKGSASSSLMTTITASPIQQSSKLVEPTGAAIEPSRGEEQQPLTALNGASSAGNQQSSQQLYKEETVNLLQQADNDGRCLVTTSFTMA